MTDQLAELRDRIARFPWDQEVTASGEGYFEWRRAFDQLLLECREAGLDEEFRDAWYGAPKPKPW